MQRLAILAARAPQPRARPHRQVVRVPLSRHADRLAQAGCVMRSRHTCSTTGVGIARMSACERAKTARIDPYSSAIAFGGWIGAARSRCPPDYEPLPRDHAPDVAPARRLAAARPDSIRASARGRSPDSSTTDAACYLHGMSNRVAVVGCTGAGLVAIGLLARLIARTPAVAGPCQQARPHRPRASLVRERRPASGRSSTRCSRSRPARR